MRISIYLVLSLGVFISFAGEVAKVYEELLPLNESVQLCSQSVETTQVDDIGAYLTNLFNTSSYPSRWNCGLWTDFEGWFMIISDLSIFFAYLSLPFLLLFLVFRKHKVLPFKRFLYLFAAFILLCGFSHLIDAVIFWEPLYRLSGFVKFLTGIVSWVTVIAVAKALPIALTYQSPQVLKKEIQMRKLAQEQLNNFVKYTPGAVAMFDKDMRYILASDRWYVDYRLEGQEIIGKSHYEVFPEIGEDWKQIHQDCLRGATSTSDGTMFLREDGSRLWITWNVRPWYDGNGEIGGLIIQTEDITEAKAAAENIRLSEEKFRRAFDYSAIGMAIVGLQGEWVQVNNSLCNMLGYTRQELHHLTFQDITHPDDLEADIGLLKELVAGNRDSYQMEKRYFHKDGQIVWILLTVSMVTDSKKAPLFFISQIVDISARKEAEQRLEKYMSSLEEKNKELEQFTYITSHDLREPLNTISSFVDLIKSDCKEEGNNALLEQLDFISESATRMRDLIRELLDFSRLNRQSAHVPVDLKEVVKDVISDLNHSINASKVQIQVEDLPIVTGNKAQLRILFQNLIGNGVKFRNPDSQDSLITIGSVVRDGNNFIYVRDNGIGIDPQHHKKIFLIFQKLHHREQFEGTGIGLASCKKIVQMHGGEISVESETGKGTTFYFTLKE